VGLDDPPRPIMYVIDMCNLLGRISYFSLSLILAQQSVPGVIPVRRVLSCYVAYPGKVLATAKKEGATFAWCFSTTPKRGLQLQTKAAHNSLKPFLQNHCYAVEKCATLRFLLCPVTKQRPCRCSQGFLPTNHRFPIPSGEVAYELKSYRMSSAVVC